MIERMCKVCNRASEGVPQYCKWCEKEANKKAKKPEKMLDTYAERMIPLEHS
jgi:hypothetical protein